jgi:hypothetical protein
VTVFSGGSAEKHKAGLQPRFCGVLQGQSRALALLGGYDGGSIRKIWDRTWGLK